MKLRIAASLALITMLAGTTLAQDTPITTTRIASGFASPLWVGSPPDDASRLFVVEQNSEDVHVINSTTGADLGLFINISGKVNSGSNERGLLGMAFDPDYSNNGFFYLSYTRTGDAASIIERYSVLGSPATSNTADAGSGTVIFGPMSQPQSNHNGGGIVFGADGKLYFGSGDGGGANDTGAGHAAGGNGQDITTLLGKMIRINSDGTIPSDNPFFGVIPGLDEIWSIGMRNPWRFSFDRETGDMYVGDVGQNAREEVDFEFAAGPSGQNYGWRCMEGFNCTGLSGCVCNDPSLTLPIRAYTHANGRCSITGGYAYRGDCIPDYDGYYFHADYCTAQIWTLKVTPDGTTFVDLVDRTAELDPPIFNINLITSFGEDADGELFIVDQGGEIFKIIPDTAFKGIGCALPGILGDPILAGEGSLAAGSAGALHLSRAAPVAQAVLFASLGTGSVSFKGGTLKTVPIIFQLAVVTDGAGEFDLSWASWPTGVPPSTELGLQYAIADASAVNGVSLSNALVGTTP